jgi:hypothetical protein
MVFQCSALETGDGKKGRVFWKERGEKYTIKCCSSYGRRFEVNGLWP